MGQPRVGMLPWALLPVLWLCGELAVAQSRVVPDVACDMGAPAGALRYRAGVWGVVEFAAINRTSEPAEAEAVLRFVDDLTLQFARRVTIPPHAMLRTTCPVLIPAFVSPTTRHVECLTEQVFPAPSERAKSLSPQEVLASSQPIILDPEVPAVAMMADLDAPEIVEVGPPYYIGTLPEPPLPDGLIYELVLAARRSQNLSRRVSTLDVDDLPIDPASLAVVDVFVVSSDRLGTDPGGIALVRDWVLGGGHLWVMLDEVQADTVAAILGDAFATTIVDRVNLTHMRMQNARFDMMEPPCEEADFEEPVTLVRVIPDGVTVTATVDQWPASFWQPLGAGRVFFTTLSAPAWMRRATWRDPKTRSNDDNTDFVSRQGLVSIAEECLVPRSAPELDTAALQPVLAQQIGYRILSRQAVAALLAAFCASLVVMGCWFARVRRLERLLWMAPLAAAITGVAFLLIAVATKRSVPPTVATMARAVMEPGVGTGHVYGLAAMYNQDACDELLGAESGGVFVPDMTAMSGSRRRLVWTDEGSWHWEDLTLPAGVRTAPFHGRIPLDKTVDCTASFGAGGLQGSVVTPHFGRLEDALIALPYQPAMVVRLGADGTFTSGPDDVLAPGEFLRESLLGDRQRRRKTVYQALFQADPEVDAPAMPVLYAWTDATDMGFIFPQSKQLGATLLSLRLRLERSPEGAQVVVPAPFIPYQAIADPTGRPPVAYSNVMRTWVDSKLGVTEWLRFKLPREVLPLQLSGATLSLAIRAPSRVVELLAFARAEPVVVLSLSRPIGTFHCTLDRPELLQVDDAGGLRLAIRVSGEENEDPDDQMAVEAWRVNSLQLQVAGTVQGESHAE